MSTRWVCFHLALGCVVVVNMAAFGLYQWHRDGYAWVALAVFVCAHWLAEIWRGLTTLHDRFVHMAETIGDDDVPPGPPRGQE